MKRILLCECANADIIASGVKQAVIAGLEDAGIDAYRVPDLCRLAADRDPALGALAAPGGLTVIACHPRAVRWLIDAAGCELDPQSLRVLNMRTMEAGQIIQQALADGGASAADIAPPLPGQDAEWPPWFPVIDYERCGNCRQCLNFCLFGVYGLEGEEKIAIDEADACRAGCPACSRICPEGAIMFPMHKDPGIAGDPEASRSGLKLDLSQLFGGSSPAELASAERQRALAEQAESASETAENEEGLDDLVDGIDQMDL